MEQPSFLHKSGRAIMKTATSTKPGTRCLCLGAPRDRACPRRERWDRRSFRAAARGGIGCRRSYARCGPVPLRLTYLVGRSAGPCLRSQGTLGQVELSRCRARGIIGSRRSYARSGPVPLRLTYFGGAPRSWGRSRICVICGTDPVGRPRRSTLPSRHRVNLVRCGGGAECFRWRWLRGFGSMGACSPEGGVCWWCC